MGQRNWPEQQLGEWQQWLELAQKAGLKVGLWDWDVVANTVTWSDETYRQMGFTRDTFSGRVKDATARIHPEDRAKVEKEIQKVLVGSSEYAAQYRVVWPDETLCWIEAHGVVVRNDPAIHMLGIGIDVTNLKKAEQSGQESEENYLLLLNSTAEGIYGLDLNEHCTFCNPACLRLLGYQAPEDLLGKSMHELVHHTRADGKPYPKEECEIHVGVREQKPTHLSGEVLWRADGTYFPVECWSYPMHKSGAFVGSVVTFIDISERERAEQSLRESEEKYRNLVENATYGILRSNLEGDFLDVNPALVAMLGYSTKSELMTCNLNRDIYEHPTDRGSILEMFRTSKRVDSAEVNWKRKDGKTITMRISGGEIRGEDGQVKHFEVIVEDITERRSLEKQLLQAQKMEAVGRLSGGVAHDFNNLLMVISSSAQLIQDATDNRKTVDKYAAQIRSAAEKAATLTRQLLAFSRQQLLQPVALDLNAVVTDLGKMLPRLLGEDIEVVASLYPQLGHITADHGQVEQIIMNLAVNARDAMPDGGKLTVETANVELDQEYISSHGVKGKPGSYVMLAMTDTGTGMTPEVQSRIFEPFFTTKELGKGTGLGLATVYGIVKQSDGWIWVYSEPGQGSTFKVYLPRTETTLKLKPDRVQESIIPLKGTETILLVEDEGTLRQVTSEYLRGKGYRVLQAENGPQALEIIEQFEGLIHVLITDMVMPGFGGPKLAEECLSKRPDTRIVFVSGYTERTMNEKITATDAIFLQKPFSLNMLAEKIRAVLKDFSQ